MWSSEYSAACSAIGVRHDLEAMLWFAMLWVQGHGPVDVVQNAMLSV